MKKVLVTLALVTCFAVTGVVGHHSVTKQAGETAVTTSTTTATTTISDPGDGSRP